MYQSADQAYYVPHARDFEGQGMVSPTGGRSGKRGQTPFSEACPRQADSFFVVHQWEATNSCGGKIRVMC